MLDVSGVFVISVTGMYVHYRLREIEYAVLANSGDTPSSIVTSIFPDVSINMQEETNVKSSC